MTSGPPGPDRSAEDGAVSYRSNPAYRLVGFDELGEDERSQLGSVVGDPSFYGVLVPRQPGSLTVKLVGHQTARLFQDLATGGPLPPDWRSTPVRLQLSDLVAARILEVGESGAFTTGLAALALLDPPSARPADGALTRLSMDAIAYAQALELPSPQAISGRLYAFNRVPAGPSLRARYPTTLVKARLEAAVRTRLHPRRDWSATTASPTWSTYTRAVRASRTDDQFGVYKLYVSPAPEQFFDVLERALPAIVDTAEVVGWKACHDLPGLLRPDKFIVYVRSADSLVSLGAHLRTALDGIPAQGVPFTAELGGDGLLSWGLDPPRISPGPGAVLSDSWRTWLTDRLGAALWEARQQGIGAVSACEAALHRLEVAGVDTQRWMPTESLFPRTETDG